MFSAPRFTGLENYVRMFMEDDVFITALSNTVLAALIIGPAGYLLSFFLAWIINELPPVLRAVLTLVFYAPSISGASYVVWSFIFSADSYGLANSFLLQLGLIDTPLLFFSDASMALPLVIAVQLWLSLGVGFLAFIAGLQNTDRSLAEAGAVDGIRDRFQELWYITLPQMIPSLMFGAVMQIVSSFTVADISVTLAGFPSAEYAGETIVTHIMDVGNQRYEMGYACAIAGVLFILMIAANKLVTRAINGIGT